MESSDKKTIVSTIPLAKQFFLHSLSLFGLAVSGPIYLTYQFYRLGEVLESPPLDTLLLPIVSIFVISILISLALVRRITFSLTKRIRDQSFAVGYVEDIQGFFFSNFGSNLFLGMTTGLFILGFWVCPWLWVNAGTMDFSYATKRYFSCQTLDFSILAFVAAIGMVYFLWMLFQVKLLEKETNNPILVHHYKKRDSSLLGITILTAVVAYLITQGFYQLFTLGAQ